MKTELGIPSINRFLTDLAENTTAIARTATIHKIYEEGYGSGENDTLDAIGPEQVCVGNKVCETLAENMKAEYLAEIFDQHSEADFRKMVKFHEKLKKSDFV